MQPIVKINLKKLRKNFNLIKDKVGNSKIYGVIKADAYGHGSVQIAKALFQYGIDGFCVAHLQEIVQLRKSKIDLPILHLGCINSNMLDIFDEQTFCTINSVNDISVIHEYCLKNKKRMYVHVKFDTGMGRLGIRYNEAKYTIEKISKLSSISVKGIYSHFSNSDIKDVKYMDIQRERFQQIKSIAMITLNEKINYHIANSAGTFLDNDNHFDLVRTGISLYGINPINNNDGFMPIMNFMAPVVLLKKILKGDSIGYDRTYIANEDLIVAYIQAGYADGIPLNLSNNGHVEYKNKLYPILGRISMDLVCINTFGDKFKLEDFVSIWGSENLNVKKISMNCNQNAYSLLTGISKRVKKEYLFG